MGERDDLKRTFDQAALLYDRARPEYPEELFDGLLELTGLEPGARLLEVGCGTGKATRPLAARGYSVTCVELGARLADVARESLAAFGVEVQTAPFETWSAETNFDLVYAATSWHWLDPETKYSKAHALLRRGGHLAFWGAAHGFPTGFDPFFTEIQAVYDEIGESHDGEWPPPAPEDMEDDSEEIRASALFDVVGVRRYQWAVEYDADAYIPLLETFSGHIAMPQWKRDRLYGAVRDLLRVRPTGRVLRHWRAILHVAQRRDVASD